MLFSHVVYARQKKNRVITAQEEWTPHAKFVLHVKADVAIHAPEECERFLTHRMKSGGASRADSQVDRKMALRELGGASVWVRQQCQWREHSTLAFLVA